MIRLGEITKIRTGKLDANASSESGKYPFFTCSKEPLKIDSYSYDCECVLVAGNGDLNVKYYNGKFDAYQRTYIIEDDSNERLFMPYLYYFLEGYVDELRKQAIGGVIKYIKLGNLTEAKIDLKSIEEQKKIVERLEKVKLIINNKKREIDKLDVLIKARFVEMFGDPESNSKGWPVASMSSICKVGSSKRIYQNEQTMDGVPFMRISNLMDYMDTGELKTDLYIPEDRYNELTEAGQVPVPGDILVTSRGTLGRCYIIKESDRFYFQDGMISWLSQFKDYVLPLYISYLFDISGFRKQIDNMQAGSTVAYLSIAMIKKLNVMVPELGLQEQFASFVRQVDKSKFVA